MLIPQGTLILVTDGARMQLLRNCGAGADPKLEVVREKTRDTPPNRDLMSDAPGRGFASVGAQRHAYAEVDAHHQREQEFARGAVETLASAATDAAAIVLIAPPRALGELRKCMSARLRGEMLAEIGKDLAHARPDEIAAYLRDYWPDT